MKKSNRDLIKMILEMDYELNRIQDLDLLLEQILYNARKVVSADAGSIYTEETNRLHIRYTQNEELEKKLKPGEKLIYSQFNLPIDDSTISGYCAHRRTTLNIPDMYRIPKTRPYCFNDRYDRITGYKTVSSLTFPLVSNQEKVLGVLQLINKKSEDGSIVRFTKEDETVITHFASVATMALQRAKMTRTLILRMIRAARLRDPKETGAHVNRVGGVASELYEAWARKNKKPEAEITKNRDTLRIASMLHDVGKVAISDQILKKPGKLTDEEYKIMQLHTVKSAELLGDTESDMELAALEVALYHHQNWDGSGYPGQIDITTGEVIRDASGNPIPMSGEEIPLYARIVAIADVYDALCSRRAYKEPWDLSEVMKEMQSLRGTKFDPELIDLFFMVLPNIQHVWNKYPDVSEESR